MSTYVPEEGSTAAAALTFIVQGQRGDGGFIAGDSAAP